MEKMATQYTISEQHLENIVNRINSNLIERKSFEILDAQGRPLITTPEVIKFADESLQNKGVDATQTDEKTGWDIYWSREMAATMVQRAHIGGTYGRYLPGRFLHYDLLSQMIASLFNGSVENTAAGKEIAEIGCGSGLSLHMLASKKGANITGLDYSVMALDFAKYLAEEHYNVAGNFVLRDYFDTGFKDETFDVVYNAGVFEHLKTGEQSQLLREMTRITKPGGFIVICMPNEESPFYRGFKQREKEFEKKYPDLVRTPVENRRYTVDAKKLFKNTGLDFVKEDGILIAPSNAITSKDIAREDLNVFDEYLPKQNIIPQSVDGKIATWARLELMNDSPHFRTHYGWSRVYIAHNPILLL